MHRDSELMRKYVGFVYYMMDEHPQPELYVALMEAYRLFNDLDKHERTREIANYYYPGDKRFNSQAGS